MNKKVLELALETFRRDKRHSLTINPMVNSELIQINSPSKILPLLPDTQQRFFGFSESKIVGNASGGNVGSGGGGDQQSDKSDEDLVTVAGNNFVTFIREFRLKRRIMAFIYDLPFKRAKRLMKRHFVMISDPSSKFKVYSNQRQTQQSTSSNTDQLSCSKVQIQEIKENQQNECGLVCRKIARVLGNAAKETKSKVLKFLHKVPLFDYQSDKKLFWDLLYCICSLLFFYCIPVHVAFDLKVTDIISLPFLAFSWATIFLHILISLNTCYYEKGILVNQRPKILHNYIQKTFLVDLSQFLPLSIIMSRETNETAVGGDNPFQILLSILFVFGIFEFQKVVISIEERFHLSTRLTYFIQLCKILISIIYFLLSSLKLSYYLIYYLSLTYSHASGSTQGFYFVTVTMISVGYGDIIPQTSSEIILCIIIMLISCGVFAYSVNSIGDILKNIYMQDNIVKQQVRIIDSFMAKNNINQHLRQQIRIYLEYYQRQFSEQNEKEEQNIISHLSENLKNSLMIEANKFILRESPIFSKYFSEGVIEKLVSIIKEYRCTPEQVIKIFKAKFKKNVFLKVIYERNIEKEDPKIYFIKSGIVEIFAVRASSSKSSSLFPLQKTSVKLLKQGESFGEFQFFTGNNNTYSARSLEFSRILYISRRDFLEILKQYPQDYEKFCFIKDKISFQKDASCISLKCYICESQKHLIENCNLPHCVFDKGHVIRRQNFVEPAQDREIFLRKWFKVPWHSQLEEIRESAWRLQDDNESYIENASWMSWDSESYAPSDQEEQIEQSSKDHQPQSASQFQKNLSNKYEFENHMNDRKGSESFKGKISLYNESKLIQINKQIEPRKAVQLRHGIDQLQNIESSPNNHLYQKALTPSNQNRQNHYQKQINEGESSDYSPSQSIKRSETNKSQKKKNDKSLVAKHQNSPVLGPSSGVMFSDQINQNSRKALKQYGKTEKKEEINNKSNHSLKSQTSEVANFVRQTSKTANNKLSAFNVIGGSVITPRNTGGGTTPVQFGKQLHSPQILRKITQGLQQGQQSTGGTNAQINIAELIGNQLLMNNKNTYMEKLNEENTFDVKKIYEFYYKHNNYPVILKKYNKPILKLIKILQKNRLKKRINQSFFKDPKCSNPAGNSHLQSPKKSFFKQEMGNAESVHGLQKFTNQNQLTLPKKALQNTLASPNSAPQQLEVDSSMVSFVLSKNTSRCLLPPISPSPPQSNDGNTQNPSLVTDDFNFQNTRLLETLAAHSAIKTNNSKNYLNTQTESSENQFTQKNYRSEDHLENQIIKLKQKQAIQNQIKENISIVKPPSINLQSIIKDQSEETDEKEYETPIGGYHPQHSIQNQKHYCQVKELLKHKNSDFTTIEEKTQEYILPNSGINSSSQNANSPTDEQLLSIKKQKKNNLEYHQNNRKSLSSRNYQKDFIQQPTITHNRQSTEMQGSSKQKKKDSVKQMNPQLRLSIKNNNNNNNEEQEKHIDVQHQNYDKSKKTKQLEDAKQQDESSSFSNQLSDDQSLENQIRYKQQRSSREKSSLLLTSSQQSKKLSYLNQEGSQSKHAFKKYEQKLSIERQLPPSLLEKQQYQQKIINDKAIGSNKRDSKSYGDKKMSIRRYSRAYNMALFKRQSTQKEQEFLEPPLEVEDYLQEKVLVKNSSASSSPSSNNSSKKVAPPFAKPLQKLQIDNFRFDMD